MGKSKNKVDSFTLRLDAVDRTDNLLVGGEKLQILEC